jgi:VanZ family protein
MKNLSKWGRGLFVWMPTYIWAFVILIFTIIPFKGPELAPSGSDKIFHFLEYLLFAILVTRSLSLELEKTLPITICLFVLAAAGAYGVLMELIQALVPGRHPSVGDVFANFSGIIVGIIIGKFILWQKLNRSKE